MYASTKERAKEDENEGEEEPKRCFYSNARLAARLWTWKQHCSWKQQQQNGSKHSSRKADVMTAKAGKVVGSSEGHKRYDTVVEKHQMQNSIKQK